ncbi:MAG TPA: matrixin family metalloprotease [Nitrosomonas sp.]|nr:matrixin family metalloprotease [Nitrosomonas sp.]
MKTTMPIPSKYTSIDEIQDDSFVPSEESNPFAPAETELHRYGQNNSKLCCTEKRGYPTPNNRQPTELVLDASEGFIPLWVAGRVLHYRFNEQSMRYFQNSVKAKTGIRTLFGEAVLAWGEAAPIGFKENTDTYDFEIYMNRHDDGSDTEGYVLASAFFPSSGRDRLTLYPKMFEQSRKEQVETLIHEIGHIFGLRHFFAAELENSWPSEIFGEHNKFSIMNYGANSMLTDTDKSDLKKLYDQVWKGTLRRVNGTPIRQVKPFHDLI